MTDRGLKLTAFSRYGTALAGFPDVTSCWAIWNGGSPHSGVSFAAASNALRD